jgi:N-acyl homoserine lactone hydrolase
MGLSIRALCVGRVFGLPKPSFTYLRGLGETLDLPLIMFVIEGGESPIVVDTGADVTRAWDLHRIRMEQTEAETPDVALRSVGIDPDDVRLVVNTHLHWDHSSNNHLFPNARVIVQRRELEYACRPVPWHRVHFEVRPEVAAAWRSGEAQLSPIDGDTEIAPGVTAVTLPGHTPGSQGVLVDTGSGRYLIAGDCLYLYENWEGDDQVDHIPVGLYTDLVAYDESLCKIETLNCQVIPSHDFRVLDRQPFA